MALVVIDRAKETTTTTGTGTVTLLGAVTGFQSLAGVGNTNTTFYCIADQVGNNWEVGVGTYSTTGPTLARTTVLSSSNGGSPVAFTSGTKDVFVTLPSAKAAKLEANTFTGSQTINGANALRGSYGGGAITSNFAAGNGTLAFNTTGSSNTAVGLQALYLNDSGDYNTAVGSSALAANTTGSSSTAIGTYTLTNNTTGDSNTAIGSNALELNSTGYSNTAVGVTALLYNTTGYSNTAVGMQALLANDSGSGNTAVGDIALLNNGTGNSNTAVGNESLYNNTTGNRNTAVGHKALKDNTTGSGNTALSPVNSAGTYLPVFNPTTESNRFCMGSTSVTNAYVKVAWTVVSDSRDKTNFAPVPHGLDFVTKLQPTSYQYKQDRATDVATGIVRYGFLAQDILALEGSNPVIIDNEDSDKLRFNSDSLIPVLVNAIQELNAKFDAYVLAHP